MHKRLYSFFAIGSLWGLGCRPEEFPPLDTSGDGRDQDTAIESCTRGPSIRQVEPHVPCILDEYGQLSCHWSEGASSPDCNHMETPAGRFSYVYGADVCRDFALIHWDTSAVTLYGLWGGEKPGPPGEFLEYRGENAITAAGEFMNFRGVIPPPPSQLPLSRLVTMGAFSAVDTESYWFIDVPQDQEWSRRSRSEAVDWAAGEGFVCHIDLAGDVQCDGQLWYAATTSTPAYGLDLPAFSNGPYERLFTFGTGLCATTVAGEVECTVLNTRTTGDYRFSANRVMDTRGPYLDLYIMPALIEKNRTSARGCARIQETGELACFGGYTEEELAFLEGHAACP